MIIMWLSDNQSSLSLYTHALEEQTTETISTLKRLLSDAV